MSASSEARPIADELAERAVLLHKRPHARPAGQIAQAAFRRGRTTIELTAGHRRANARGVLAVLVPGAVTGTGVLHTVTGRYEATIAEEDATIAKDRTHNPKIDGFADDQTAQPM